jgi:hypothetical protein
MKNALDDNLTWFGCVEDYVRLIAKAKQAVLQVIRAPAHTGRVRKISKRLSQSRHVDIGLPPTKHVLRGLKENLNVVFGGG